MSAAVLSVFATLPLPLEGAQHLGGSSGPDLTRYVLVCAGLLAAVAGLALGLRRLVREALSKRAARRSLSIVDVLPLSGKQRLAVVRCYERTFLIGLGEREIEHIAELGEEAQSNGESHPAAAPSRADAHGFAQVLQRVWRGPEGAPPPPTARPAAARRGEGVFG